MTTDNWYPLPPDMSQWNNVILENLAQHVPSATNYISGLEWSNLNPATGEGDGVIQMMNGMCAIPITIKENKLAPIDTIASNYGSEPKFYPLTETFLQKIYADNVIGQPVTKGAKEDEDYLGPSVKIKHIRTVDNIKHASRAAAQRTLDMIVKSASVSNWMIENMPEVLTALNDRVNTVEKEASTEDVELPDLMMVWKDGNNFYANGNLIDADAVSTVTKMAGASTEEVTNLMNGIPFVRDFREKVAAIHIPSEQEVVAMDIEDNRIFDIGGNRTRAREERYPDICVTTAYMKDGTSKRGVIFTGASVKQVQPKTTVENPNPQDQDPSIVPENFYETHFLELFVCDEGYSLNYNIKTDARIALPGKTVMDVSTPSNPSIGMIGALIESDDPEFVFVKSFGRVEDITSAGKYKFYRMYDMINHNMISVKVTPETFFYEVPDNRLATVTAPERTSFVSATGINGILRKTQEGKFVLDGESYDTVNVPFALMNKYAAAYEDAVSICRVAEKIGQCEFEVLTNVDKTAAILLEEVDTTKKKDNKNTKTGTDDETKGQQAAQPQLAQVTPEQIFSIDFGGTAAGQAPNAGDAPGAGQAGKSGQGVQAGYIDPVSANDLENVVNVNSPKTMDAYLMASLNGDVDASQENLARTSDSIVDALEHLSKMLFLVRNGSFDFVSETDIQAAMQKLNDILSTIGIQPTKVGQ